MELNRPTTGHLACLPYGDEATSLPDNRKESRFACILSRVWPSQASSPEETVRPTSPKNPETPQGMARKGGYERLGDSRHSNGLTERPQVRTEFRQPHQANCDANAPSTLQGSKRKPFSSPATGRSSTKYGSPKHFGTQAHAWPKFDLRPDGCIARNGTQPFRTLLLLPLHGE